MHWQNNPYVLLLIASVLLSSLLAVYGWRHRTTRGAVPFTTMMVAVTVWSLGYACEKASRDLWFQKLSAYIQVPAYAAVPSVWLWFVLQYTDRTKWLTRRTLAGLAIAPVAVVLIAWTNEYHHWFYREFDVTRLDGLVLLDVTFGPGFWVYYVFALPLLFTGTFLLIRLSFIFRMCIAGRLVFC